MGTLKKIIYNCRHATLLIEKRQHTSLTIRERIHLIIHLSGCGICRLFQRQSRMITHMMRELFRDAANRSHQLDESVKQQMQDRINEELLK